MKLFNFFTTTALIVDANKVRTPEERQSKNELFLKKWFGNNCKGEEYRGQDDAVRPFRCQNKLDRYMIEWEKLQRNFAECGHFDLQAAVTGKNKGGRRRRNDDDDDEYDWEDYHNNEGSQGLFDNDLWDLTDEELAEIEREEKDGNGSADETDDYWFFFQQFADDYPEFVEGSQSTADEENAQVRTRQDLRPQEQRALSAKPDRAHRQLINSMKQFVKRFLDQCDDKDETLARLTVYYRRAHALHEFVMSVVAEKYQRMNERALRRASRL